MEETLTKQPNYVWNLEELRRLAQEVEKCEKAEAQLERDHNCYDKRDQRKEF